MILRQKNKPNRILITGAGGSIGSALIGHLMATAKPSKGTIFIDKCEESESHIRNHATQDKRVRIILAEIRDLATRVILSDSDKKIHPANCSGVDTKRVVRIFQAANDDSV